MYDRYSLTLMLTHDCNLRCSYCYMGEKARRVMPEALGKKAIDRALSSLAPEGELQLAFFGGEPLLETVLLRDLMEYAQLRARETAITLRMGLTTNGTIASPTAWDILMHPGLDVAVSCDGVQTIHDRHRRFADGGGSWQAVSTTIRRLVESGREFHVACVVRPDTLEQLCESAVQFRAMGVRLLEPALDVWARWSDEDIARLERVVQALADVWRDGLPDFRIGWFEEKAAHLARLKVPPPTRCGFGDGAVAVAPSGALYPCERLIGQDLPDNPMRIRGNAADGADFLHLAPVVDANRPDCSPCAMEGLCNTFCRCSNYVRTGDSRRPDRLLCRWNQACLENTARVLKELSPERARSTSMRPAGC